MRYPTYIMSRDGATLWSWGNYEYSIDYAGQRNYVVMYDTDFDDAVARFVLEFGK